MEAIVGGSVDVRGFPLELGMQLAEEGRHVQSFVTLMDRPSYVLALSPAAKRKVQGVTNLKGAVIAVLLVLCLASCRHSEPGGSVQTLTRVRVAVPSSPITYLPVYLARELGYYAEQGLDVELQEFSGGSKGLQAMFGGSADACAGFYELSIPLAAEGRHVQSFLTILERPGYILAVSPSSKRRIVRVEDLRGAIVGVSTPSSSSQVFLNYLLRRHGVSLQDVSVSSIGLGPLSIAAFTQGRVDAAVITGSAITSAQRRFPKLVSLADARTREGVRKIYGIDVYPAHDLLAERDGFKRIRQLRGN